MPFGETKVYFDGSHYIAIPYVARPSIRKAIPKPEEVIELYCEEEVY